MFGNCPKCGKAVMQLSQQQIAVPPAFDQHSLKATTLSCLSCKTIIGVVPDYCSLVKDVAAHVVEDLKKQKPSTKNRPLNREAERAWSLKGDTDGLSLPRTISGSNDDEVRRGSAARQAGPAVGLADGPANLYPGTGAF